MRLSKCSPTQIGIYSFAALVRCPRRCSSTDRWTAPQVATVADICPSSSSSPLERLTNASILKWIQEGIPEDLLSMRSRGADELSEVRTLDASADIAAFELRRSDAVLTNNGSKGQELGIPHYTAASRCKLASSGGVFMSSQELEDVHRALRKQIESGKRTAPGGCRAHKAIPFVVGCDEAGRGPLAGPVVCAAFSRILMKRSVGGQLEAEGVDKYYYSNGEGSGSPVMTMVPESTPAMDSKQVPEAVRSFSFSKLARNSSLLQDISRLNVSMSIDSLLGNSMGQSKLESLIFHTLTNPIPRSELEHPSAFPPASSTLPQTLVRVDSPLKASEGKPLAALLEAAVRADHPPLIITIPFTSVVSAPAISSLTLPTIGAVRKALREYELAVKAGEKAVAAAAKKALREKTKAEKERQKQQVKIDKARAKALSKGLLFDASAHEPKIVDVSNDSSASAGTSTPDWQPNGLHPALAALYPSPSESAGASSWFYLQMGAVSIVNHQYIDGSNIVVASMHGMSAAVAAVISSAKQSVIGGESNDIQTSPSLSEAVDSPIILVDGSAAPIDLVESVGAKGIATSSISPASSGGCVIPVTKGDSTSYSIGAASMLAKVTRDAVMKYYGAKYPAYGFESHEGYPCPAHMRAIDAEGLCPIHRLSYGPCRNSIIARKGADAK